MLRRLGAGADEPGVGRETFRLLGDLTALADGRLGLLAADGDAHELGDVLAPLVGDEPDRVPGTGCPLGGVGRGDRHIGRVSPVLEVLDRHQGLGQTGAYVPGRPARPRRSAPRRSM